eukprot:366044-Chlamydomonas_euryale.AAC.2
MGASVCMHACMQADMQVWLPIGASACMHACRYQLALRMERTHALVPKHACAPRNSMSLRPHTCALRGRPRPELLPPSPATQNTHAQCAGNRDLSPSRQSPEK